MARTKGSKNKRSLGGEERPTVSLRLDQDVHKMLNEIADKNSSTLSKIIHTILKNYLTFKN